MITRAKTEDIKVRVDPLSKRVLTQIAVEDDLSLSDIIRRAINELISKHQASPRSPIRKTTPYVR